MAVQSDTLRPLYQRLYDDMSKSPDQSVRLTDYTNEFSEWQDFPSGGINVNAMTRPLNYLARPTSHGVRIDIGFTKSDMHGTKYGAVLRVAHGKYRWYPVAEWADDTTLYIQPKSKYDKGLPNVARLRKYNKDIKFIDRPAPAEPTYQYPDHGMWSAADNAHAIAAFEAPFRKDQYKVPVPDPATRVTILPPPTIKHYDTPAKVMSPLAEVVHRDGTTIIIKTDGKVLVCKIQSEVK